MHDAGLTETGPAPKPANDDFSIRELEINDLPAVLQIEKRSFPAPWSQAMFMSEMTRQDAECFAAECSGTLIGYLISTGLDGARHLNNVAVDPAFRGRGFGARLMRCLLERVGEAAQVTLEVRPSNDPAIGLYRRFGFEEAGIRKAYYPDNKEDALIMWRNRPIEVPGPAQR